MRSRSASSRRSQPLENALEAARQADAESMGSGGLVQARQTYFTTQMALADLAPRVADLTGETERALALAWQHSDADAVASFLAFRQFGRALLGLTSAPGGFDDEEFSEAAHLAAIAGNTVAIAHYHIYRAVSAAIFGDAAALQQAAELLARTSAISNSYPAALAEFIRALDLADRLGRSAANGRESMQSEFDACLAALQARASAVPANFAHLAALLEAEKLALETPDKALAAFDAAVTAAEAARRPWHHALACERAAGFCERQGYTSITRHFLRDARDTWACWGAAGKVAHLEGTRVWLTESRSAQLEAANEALSREVSERERAEATLDEKNRFLSTLLDHLPIGVSVMDAASRRLVFSNRMGDVLAGPGSGRHPVADDLADVFHVLRAPGRTPYPVDEMPVVRALSGEQARVEDVLVVHPDGTEVALEVIGAPLRDKENRVTGSITIYHDITERKLADERLRQLNRELRAVSECNQVLIRASDEQTLLDDVCRIICGEAGYRMAWVGMIERNEAKTIRPVAWGGCEDRFLTGADSGRGPWKTAIRTGRPSFVQDLLTDPALVPWRQQALAHGFYSMIVLPLAAPDGEVFGVLTLYGPQPDVFMIDEVRLLEGLAGDLSFGISSLRTRAQAARAEAEREAAQAALRYQNALLEAQKETSLDGISVMTLKGELLSFNQRFIDMWRIPPGAAETGNIDSAVASVLDQVVDPEAFLARVRYLYEHEDERASDEVSLKDGRVFDRFSAPIKDSTGNSYGRIWFFRDISDRRRAEQALLASEERFRTLMEQAPVAIAVSRDGRTIWGNPNYLRMFGFDDVQDLVGHPLVEQVAPAQREEVMERVRQAILDGLPTWEMDIIGVRKDGSQFPFHVAVGDVELADGPAVVGYFSDITERKRADEQLVAAHQQLTDIIEFLPDATLVIDQDGKVIAWNRVMESMTGIKKAEMVGRGDYAYTVPFYGFRQPVLIDLVNSPAGRYEPGYHHIKQDGQTLSAEAFAPALSGGKGAYLWGHAAPLFDPQGNHYGAIEVVRDITDRVEAEKELEQHRKNLEELVHLRTADLEEARVEALSLMQEATQQRRMAEAALADKEVLLREIHHRVKNNLNTVSNLLYFQAKALNDEQAKAAFEESRQRIQSMARVHEHLYRSHSLARVNMDSYLNSLAADLNHSLGVHPVPIVTHAPGIMLHVDNAVPCGLVVNELVSNALKHAFPDNENGAKITIQLTAKDGLDVLAVSDNGVGLPENFDISHVRSLGLRLVGMLARQLHGRLDVTSVPGQGATFRITFPDSKVTGDAGLEARS